ncbi:hypothetical protein B0H16DRAFT_278720 [Mycena metata]|uniref:Uncharacterized protein n=1 Tax=Mycena metata TaxID=1033252 RepID=A0AAD7MPW5_9AGAR|nr:hypothetical protein B0H16DRAFT_278720 [Mycena metata]
MRRRDQGRAHIRIASTPSALTPARRSTISAQRRRRPHLCQIYISVTAGPRPPGDWSLLCGPTFAPYIVHFICSLSFSIAWLCIDNLLTCTTGTSVALSSRPRTPLHFVPLLVPLLSALQDPPFPQHQHVPHVRFAARRVRLGVSLELSRCTLDLHRR